MADQLAAFDFDGTLSPTKITNLLGEAAGVGDRMASVTELALSGQINYTESLQQRVSLLSGLPLSEVEATFDGIELRDGVPELLEELDESDVVTVIITNGFRTGVQRALDAEAVTVDHLIANRLGTANGHLDGEVHGPLVKNTKDKALRAVARNHRVGLDACVAVGDGANDVPMLAVAGQGVGFNATEPVRQVADARASDIPELREVLANWQYL